MDLFAAGVLTKLTADLTKDLVAGAGRRTRVALNGDANYRALQRCVEFGVVALLTMASSATPEERNLLETILRAFFDDDDVLGELSEALRGHPLNTDELTYLFGQAGYDAETLPGLDLRQALRAFEVTFLSAAAEEPALKDIIQTGHLARLVQQGDLLLDVVRELLVFLRQAKPDSVGIEAGQITAQDGDGQPIVYQLSINTGGGAYVNGDVNTGGGDFVGQTKVEIGQVVLPPSVPGNDLDALERRYLEWIVKICTPLQLRGIDPRTIGANGGDALALCDVYVGLDTDWRVPKDATSAESLAGPQKAVSERAEGAREPKMRTVSALELLDASACVALIGAPGAGKSTLLNYLALCLAGARLNQAGWIYRLMPSWTQGALLPVRMDLRDLAARSIPAEAEMGTAQMIWNHLELQLKDAGLDLFAGHVRDLAGQGQVLFLLDGLDEVPEGAKRQRVREAVEQFAGTCGASRLVVTARPYAMDGIEVWSEQLKPFALAPFNEEQIEGFVRRWYDAIRRAGWVSSQEAEDKTTRLQTALGRPALRVLAQQPLLLTLMASLHSSRMRLPDDRGDLYDEIVNLLLWQWNDTKGEEQGLLAALGDSDLKLPDIRRRIEQVAYEAHTAQGQRQGAADIDADVIIRVFRPLFGGSRDQADKVIHHIEQRAGLLVNLGEREGCEWYAFPHRTFQEYLAGCYLAGLQDFRRTAARLVRAAPTQWREVFVLGVRQAQADRGIPAVDALLGSLDVEAFTKRRGQPTNNQWRSAIIAGLALLEIGRAAVGADPLGVAVRDRVAGWLVKLLATAGALPLLERIEAGSVLARLGDPRFPLQRTPAGVAFIMPELLSVAAGPFEMGSNKEEEGAYNDEHSDTTFSRRHHVTVAEFHIAKHPVTNAEYRCYVRAAGAWPPWHWHDGEVPAGLENHPLVNVSWHDARAYCAWLTAVGREASALGLDEVVRLPSEAEWEKASRWNHEKQRSRVYPWDDGWDPARCNTFEAGPVATTTVGIYPQGASPYGILDAAGNVFEWTISMFAPYPYQMDDGREEPIGRPARVLRGGSWDYVRRFARCASRFVRPPGNRDGLVGFRVVVSPGSHSCSPDP